MKNPTARFWLSTFGAMLFVTLLAACNFSISTANLSSLKIGKDKDITTEATTFAPKDDVYAVAVVSNSGSKTTVKFQLIAEKVEGQADNFQIPGLAMSVDCAPLRRLNAAEMLVDVAQPSGGASTRWIADSGVLDLFLLLGPKPADVMAQYARLTGPTAMPQVRRLQQARLFLSSVLSCTVQGTGSQWNQRRASAC